MNLNPCRSKTRFSTSKPIWSTVSWLRGWKELQSLNLDVSHGLAQINVLSKQRAWQQALQLSPTVHCFQSVLRDTDIQAYTALPTCTTAPSHPSSQVESAPLPTPPPETAPPPHRTCCFSLQHTAQEAHHQQHSLSTDSAGKGLPSHAPPPPSPACHGAARERSAHESWYRTGTQGPFPRDTTETPPERGRSAICRLNAHPED